MKLSSFAIGIAMMSLVIVGFFIVLNQSADRMPSVSVNTSQNASFNKLADIEDMANKTSTTLQGGKIDQADAVFTLSVSAWQGLKIVFNSFNIFTDVMRELWKEFSFPPYMLGAILAMVSIAVTFVLINAIFQRNL